MSDILFISDLHLDESEPDIYDHFKYFLENIASSANTLYILGDLFEAWVGDDDDDDFYGKCQQDLKKLSAITPIYFIHGNRDFLIGQQFSEKTGITILEDTQLIEYFNSSAVITHGDLLCTDDIDYQKMRQLFRSQPWQQEMLSKSLLERRQIAKAYRMQSTQNNSNKSYNIMDVNPQAVAETLTKHNSSTLIHGHTHRPDRHEIQVNNKACERIVLSDWETQPSYLVWNKDGISVKNIGI